MAIQFRQPPNYPLHMFGSTGDYKDINLAFTARENYTYNSGHANILPNLPGFEDSNMTHKSDTDNENISTLIDWTRKPSQEWTKKDVLDWVYCVVEQEQLDGSKFKGEAYRDFVGCDLYQMSRDQFQKVDPCYGTIIYESFQRLLQKESVKNEKCRPGSGHTVADLFNENFIEQCWIDENNNNINTNEEPSLGRHVIEDCDNTNNLYKSDLTVLGTDNDIKVDLPSLGVYPISSVFELPFTPYSSAVPPQPSTPIRTHLRVSPPLCSSSMPTRTPWSVFSPMDSIAAARAFLKLKDLCSNETFQNAPSPFTYCSSKSPDFQLSQAFSSASSVSSRSPSCSSLPGNFLTLTTNSSDLEYSSDDSSCSLSFMPPVASPKRGDAFCSDDIAVGINDFSQMAQLNGHTLQQDGRNVKTGVAAKTGNQLWKFVLELLRDPEANPRLLKWEDRNSGVFRFVQSEKVAKLWGLKKNNPQMTYEKMSRAMRFCRSIGYFSEIDKDGRFPKKLCFKFGIKSQGWRD